MLVGYARTSTVDQISGLQAQVEELEELGCERIFSEQASAVGPRRELESAINFCREGDTFVVAKLDRLARSIQHLWETVQQLEDKGVNLRIENLGVDTAKPTGRLMLTLLGGISQFEREMMLERQREGIARAKAAGKYKGRKPTAMAKAEAVKDLQERGIGATEIARSLGISRASVYRIFSQVDGS